MNSDVTNTRPSLEEALEAWKKLLGDSGFSTDLRWIFEENFCFEKSLVANGGFHFGFQTRFSPPPEEALGTAFDHFSETKAPLVFYRVGKCRKQSICVLLCDPSLDDKTDADGYLRRDDWGLLFYPGHNYEIEEISDLGRWVRRVRRRRGFHDLDFCMTLEAINEIDNYGRPLLHYERFAQTMLHRLRRFLGKTE